MSWAKLCLEDESRKTFLSSSVLVELKSAKFGKLSSGHRTGRGRFSFQSQRREMPKNVQTATQWHSFHMLNFTFHMIMLKILDFSSMWTEKFQIYKLDLEKAKEPDIKLPKSIESQKKQENSSKISTSVSLTTLKPLCGSQQTVEDSYRDGNTRPTHLPPEKPVCRTRSNS